ncbi:CD48 antigen-like isoform X2 [Puntigrus tetrazona]|uniref:CD48 antigen-like isoform X2 n=1 Tax=Puntigrus tetrazona TaxID=1606681 RepID=UPI001C8A5AB8|nr:CD48 antigen-like isoform X2 [Puntigrus tetrazona]
MLESLIFIGLCSWSLAGVFVDDGVKSVSVMEGDSVTLNINDHDMHKVEEILFKHNSVLIAQINRMKKNECRFFNNTASQRFRDRLKLDQTGSLIITDTRTTDSGLYNVSSRKTATRLTISLTVYALFLPVPVITRDCSSSSSSSSCCSLLCSVVNVSHVTLSWYKGNSLLSSINVSDLSISLSLPLEVEHQDKNIYSCVINNPIRNQTRHLDISEVCQTSSEHDPTILNIVLISAAAAAGFLLIFAAVMIFCTCKKHKEVEDQTCTEEIIYSETTFYKRRGQNSRSKKEEEVVYAGIAVKQ